MTDNVRDYFERITASFADTYKTTSAFIEKRLVWQKHIAACAKMLPPGFTCLDLGCGSGVYGQIAAAHGAKVVAVDISRKMLSRAREMSAEKGLIERMTFLHSALPLSPTEEEKYFGQADLIICSSVLEYIEDDELVLRQISRLLRPGGTLLVSFPNRRAWYRTIERMIKITPLARLSYLRHQKRQRSLQSILELLGQCNLVIKDLEYYTLPMQPILAPICGVRRDEWQSMLILLSAAKRETAS